ncbi:hypothetical protein WICPIJ_006269 [Wickerhamomyces pijperi]|uniref:DUF676 domain-containing protein n=1 Tax=Wickerhamomyces pijperi TaxID=599730 RepID=A0A9P8Q2K3_WICPI|nr:hypothetical protein WICPIJ_006269 [Wickerhamomyces pijperi]
MTCLNIPSICCGPNPGPEPEKPPSGKVKSQSTFLSQLIPPHERLMDQASEHVLFKYKSHLNIGDVNRITIKYKYDPKDPTQCSRIESDDHGAYIWLRIKNEQNPLVRPIYLAGPFTFYTDCRPCNFQEDKEMQGETIGYNIDVKPNQAFKCKMYLNESSLLRTEQTDNEAGSKATVIQVHSWTVDVVSQLAVISKFSVDYELSIGYQFSALRRPIPYNHETYHLSDPQALAVKIQDTDALWTTPPLRPKDPVHLVVLTHGIFSNIGADMFYVKDQLEKRFQQTGENAIVRGYQENTGKSEKGIKYIGKRIAEFVVDYVKEQKKNFKNGHQQGLDITKISFIGHSLGGCTQAYAIYHIATKYPTFFQTEVKPTHFICVASPMVGILTEFSKTVSVALDLGFFAQTGRDLMLRHQVSTMVRSKLKRMFTSTGKSNHKAAKEKEDKEKDQDSAKSGIFTTKPVLEQIIVSEEAHKVFCSFENRTTYANAVNDGIVPLRTAALVYLNWQGLDDFETVKAQIIAQQKRQEAKMGSLEYSASSEDLRNIPTVERENGRAVGEISDSAGDNLSSVPVGIKDLPNNHQVEESNENNGGITQNLMNLISSGHNRHLEIKQTKGKPTTHKFSKKKLESYRLTQTTNTPPPTTSTLDDHDSEATPVSNGSEKASNNEESEPQLNIPPPASTFITAANVLFAPEPSQRFLTCPEARHNTIFHDAMYSYSDLPERPPSVEHEGFISRNLRHNTDRRLQTQEMIARRWHKGMDWRKVLVILKPDAHNNIIVRRRVTNAWGWGVIEHLIKEHF